jgi:hypothetical protein
MKQYINPLLTAGSLLALLYTIYTQNAKISELKTKVVTLQNVADSLHDEAFNANVQLGRYELTLDHLEEVNHKAAVEFVNYMNHETE